MASARHQPRDVTAKMDKTQDSDLYCGIVDKALWSVGPVATVWHRYNHASAMISKGPTVVGSGRLASTRPHFTGARKTQHGHPEGTEVHAPRQGNERTCSPRVGCPSQ